MKRRLLKLMCVLLAASCLAGCKIELYRNLTEREANTMLALLMLRNIDAEKKMQKGDSATLLVDRSQFVNAMEWLRQNGLPRQTAATVQEIFPSGQLVTSPAQEQAKILYLKEQELGQILRSIDGVVDAHVAIAESPSQNRYDPPVPSASVFVKFSPDRNLENREADIRNLVLKGVPGLQPADIALVMQRAEYRYLPDPSSQRAGDARVEQPAAATRTTRRWIYIGGLIVTIVASLGAAALFRLKRRRPS